jgi:hypothetical protein
MSLHHHLPLSPLSLSSRPTPLPFSCRHPLTSSLDITLSKKGRERERKENRKKGNPCKKHTELMTELAPTALLQQKCRMGKLIQVVEARERATKTGCLTSSLQLAPQELKLPSTAPSPCLGQTSFNDQDQAHQQRQEELGRSLVGQKMLLVPWVSIFILWLRR